MPSRSVDHADPASRQLRLTWLAARCRFGPHDPLLGGSVEANVFAEERSEELGEEVGVLVHEDRVVFDLIHETREHASSFSSRSTAGGASSVTTQSEDVTDHLAVGDGERDLVRDEHQLHRLVRELGRGVDWGHPPAALVGLSDQETLKRLLARHPSLVDLATVGGEHWSAHAKDHSVFRDGRRTASSLVVPTMPFKIATASASSRRASEDLLVVHQTPGGLVVVVADGAGDMPAGAEAADLALKIVAEAIDHAPTKFTAPSWLTFEVGGVSLRTARGGRFQRPAALPAECAHTRPSSPPG